MPRKKQSRYSGVLATPIVKPSALQRLIGNPDKDFYIDAAIAKIPALFAHYAIAFEEPWCWRDLALSLAHAHVDGFRLVRPPAKRGRRKRWHFEECRDLVAKIDAQRTGPRRTISAAINAAMKEEDWRWGRGLDSLKVRYSEAKRLIAEHQRFMEHVANIPGGIFGFLDGARGPRPNMLAAGLEAPLLGVTEKME